MPCEDSISPNICKVLRGHSKNVTSLAFNSQNDTLLASCAADNSVMLWDLHRDVMRQSHNGHSAAVTDVTFSPSGKHIATSSEDKHVIVWSVKKMKEKYKFLAHTETVRSVQFTIDGQKIITASDDMFINIWSTKNYQMSRLAGHTDQVLQASMSYNGSLIASCSVDKFTFVWDVNTGICIQKYRDLLGHATHLAWMPETEFLCVGTSKGFLKIYDIRGHKMVHYQSVHTEAVTKIAVHPSKSFIVSASEDCSLKVTDINTSESVYSFQNCSSYAINAATCAESGRFFAAAMDKMIIVWHTVQNKN